MKEIEYGMAVKDKDSNRLGEIEKIVMDSWTGEPRKFMARAEDKTEAFFFTPEQIADVEDNTVKLNLAREEMEQTT